MRKNRFSSPLFRSASDARRFTVVHAVHKPLASSSRPTSATRNGSSFVGHSPAPGIPERPDSAAKLPRKVSSVCSAGSMVAVHSGRATPASSASRMPRKHSSANRTSPRSRRPETNDRRSDHACACCGLALNCRSRRSNSARCSFTRVSRRCSMLRRMTLRVSKRAAKSRTPLTSIAAAALYSARSSGLISSSTAACSMLVCVSSKAAESAMRALSISSVSECGTPGRFSSTSALARISENRKSRRCTHP